MSLIIATGSNIGDSLNFLANAKKMLSFQFEFVAESRVYTSKAVDYLDQPDFFNQVLEFKTPALPANEIMNVLLQIETDLGRNRTIPKGPRVIDLDILFIDLIECKSSVVEIPHPRLFERSFVVLPLSELPYFKTLSEKYSFSFSFTEMAKPIS